MEAIQTYGSVQTCEGHLTIKRIVQTGGHPNIQGHPNIVGTIQTYRGIHAYGDVQTYGASKHTGDHPNIWHHLNIQGASKCMEDIWTPLSLTKHALFLLFIYRGHPNAWVHMDTLVWQSMLSLCCVCMGESKHHTNIWGCPSIQEASKHRGAPKYMGVCKHKGRHMGASKDTGSHPNIWGIKHTGGIQTYGSIQMYGGIWTPLSLTKHAFFVLCIYRGHPNIFLYNPYLHLPSWISVILFFFFLILNIFIHFLLLLWVLHCVFWNDRKHS